MQDFRDQVFGWIRADFSRLGSTKGPFHKERAIITLVLDKKLLFKKKQAFLNLLKKTFFFRVSTYKQLAANKIYNNDITTI